MRVWPLSLTCNSNPTVPFWMREKRLAGPPSRKIHPRAGKCSSTAESLKSRSWWRLIPRRKGWVAIVRSIDRVLELPFCTLRGMAISVLVFIDYLVFRSGIAAAHCENGQADVTFAHKRYPADRLSRESKTIRVQTVGSCSLERSGFPHGTRGTRVGVRPGKTARAGALERDTRCPRMGVKPAWSMVFIQPNFSSRFFALAGSSPRVLEPVNREPMSIISAQPALQ